MTFPYPPFHTVSLLFIQSTGTTTTLLFPHSGIVPDQQVDTSSAAKRIYKRNLGLANGSPDCCPSHLPFGFAGTLRNSSVHRVSLPFKLQTARIVIRMSSDAHTQTGQQDWPKRRAHYQH